MAASAQLKTWHLAKKIFVLNQLTVTLLVMILLAMLLTMIFYSQVLVERTAFAPPPPAAATAPKEQYEIAKLAAEIRQIRSDTGGSLFWLKMLALFVTVGGAVGGYLVGQSRATRARLAFEDRKNVDTAYQGIIQELSDKSPLLRAAAAVKLGTILGSFPVEWNTSDARRDQLIQLTKQVLAASLAIEKDPKVLKTLTIALVLHRPWANDQHGDARRQYGDIQGLDLSGAKAADAYWARTDCSYADFYRADLYRASFRKAILSGAQFRDAKLKEAVLIEADCTKANFKLADLRGADLTNAQLTGANFEDAAVYGAIFLGASWGDNPPCRVDLSVEGDGSQMVNLRDWLKPGAAA